MILLNTNRGSTYCQTQHNKNQCLTLIYFYDMIQGIDLHISPALLPVPTRTHPSAVAPPPGQAGPQREKESQRRESDT